MTPDALAIAQALIRCRSVTPEDGGALDAIARFLEGAGFATHRVTFSEPGTPDIANLYARLGTESPVLLFAGHTDVVPPGDVARWRFDPFAGTVADDALWGRGAVDMKGGLAAAIAAALAYVARGGPLRGSIAFLVTGDEEGPAVNGTPKLLEWARERGERFDACLLGEPTNPDALGGMMKIGRRGSLTGHLHVQGMQGHVAYPRLAKNPVPILLAVLAALKETPLDDGTAHFDPSNLEVTTIDIGNATPNLVPAEARATFNIRFNDRWTPDSLAAEITSRVARADPSGTTTLRFVPTNATAFLSQPGPFVDLVSEVIRGVTGVTPILSTTGGTSDARFIKDHCPVVEFGLVGKTMHAIDEHTAIADLETLSSIYETILDRYFGSGSSG